jgi:hypothetical protein
LFIDVGDTIGPLFTRLGFLDLQLAQKRLNITNSPVQSILSRLEFAVLGDQLFEVFVEVFGLFFLFGGVFLDVFFDDGEVGFGFGSDLYYLLSSSLSAFNISSLNGAPFLDSSQFKLTVT